MTEKHQEVFREEFDIDMEPSTSNCLQISERNKIEQFNTLLSLMREKLLKESTTRSEKNQILTMVPSEWSIRKISEFLMFPITQPVRQLSYEVKKVLWQVQNLITENLCQKKLKTL